MINVRDLMVGNLINTRHGVIEVGIIYKDCVADTRSAIYFDDEIDGIEVTEEMLEKVGFEKHKNVPLEGDFYRYWHKDYRYKLDVDKGYCNSNRRWSLHVDNGDCCTIGRGEFTYLHELQNLVRVISGYELPITKEMLYE